ncbi:MAG: hypothetical protein K8S98_10475 [Planctomycetes bacterium]|nr:hypothetical protein [Planctomycetota bacterium]
MATGVWWRLWSATALVVALGVLALLAPVPRFVRVQGELLDSGPGLRVAVFATGEIDAATVRVGDPARVELDAVPREARVVASSDGSAPIVVEIQADELVGLARPVVGVRLAVRLCAGTQSVLAYAVDALVLPGSRP